MRFSASYLYCPGQSINNSGKELLHWKATFSGKLGRNIRQENYLDSIARHSLSRNLTLNLVKCTFIIRFRKRSSDEQANGYAILEDQVVIAI